MTLATGHSIPQRIPPRSPRETLPTMYDLPSETQGEPALPDEFHDLQPQLLSRTLTLAHYSRDEWFACSDLYLYYDVHHPLWYERPDWFLAVGVPRLYDNADLRRSYVTWQEPSPPYVVIEFLSPGTEADDLGPFYSTRDLVLSDDPPPETHGAASIGIGAASEIPELGKAQAEVGATGAVNGASGAKRERPPGKFEVYEQRLRIPYYITFSRHNQTLRFFQLIGGRYHEQPIQATQPQVWLTDLQIGLGIWEGTFDGVPSCWLRWCDQSGNWLLTDTEQAQQAEDQERQAKEKAEAQILQAARNLLETGMPLDQVTKVLQLSDEQVRANWVIV